MVPQTHPLNPVCSTGDDHHHQDLSHDGPDFNTNPDLPPDSFWVPSENLSHDEPDFNTNPDLPPDSFWVPSENEFEWFDRNSFIQRKGSIKVTVSRISDRSSNLSSQQRSLSFNLKQNSSIIGLPKFHKSSLVDANLKRNAKLESIRLFRSRSEPGGNKSLQVTEPGSPRVSCMGRVGSRKGRGKSNGFWASFKSVFS